MIRHNDKQPARRQRAIAYARFSPRPNAAECESVAKQLDDIRRYCQARDIEIAGEFADKALSGKQAADERPGLFEAIRACRKGMLLIVRAFDRLFRDNRLASAIIYDLDRKGVQLVSITEEGANASTPDSEFMRGVFLLFAEYQRKLIVARTKAAMIRHQENGRRMSDSEPYGYRRDPSDTTRLVVDPQEMANVELVRALRTEGKSARAIATALEDRGIVPRGNRWHHGTITRIMERYGIE